MPIATAFTDHPTRPYVRVEINWSDAPSVEYARVLRVDPATGECVPLRPYVCYDGDYLLLSCGHGIFWDTEAPLDTPVYYLTEGIDAPCIPAADPCAPCVPTTAQSSTITVVSDGRFWLKDPVRPCNDRPVPLCATEGSVSAVCGGEGGITFVDIGAELYAPNSLSLRPTNRKRPIAVTRARADASTVLRLQTLTFTDRDDLIGLLAPGSPLLFQGPAEYGVPDRYMDVKTPQIERGVSDHRIQMRTASLPYETVDRFAGPSLGICGTRVQDICLEYPTWQALQDAGFTWDDLVRGSASSESANPDARTWDDVNAEFADWDAVNTGGRTWTGLRDGD